MALTIEGSDYGYDKNGLDEALNNIKVQVIEEASKEISDGIDNIINSVEEYWVGAGAEMFKNNLLTDKDYITKRLNAVYEEKLVANFNAFLKDMQENDQNLVEKRVW